jgi:exopolysaccharide biosynthesis polyprenyl glycosylphosphotransferase
VLKRYGIKFTLFLFISDMVLVAVALTLAIHARGTFAIGKLVLPFYFSLPLPVYVMAILIWGITLVTLGVYDLRRTTRLVGELQTLTVATLFAFLVLTGTLYLSFRDVPRLQTLYFGALYLPLVSAHRITVRGLARITGGSSYRSRRVLIVGTGDIAREVGRMVNAHAWAGLQLVGFAGDARNADGLNAPVLGHTSHTPHLVQQYGVSEVIVALPQQVERDMPRLIYDLQKLPVNLRVVPDYFDLAFLQLRVEDFGGMPLLSLKEPTLDPFQRLTKRLFDLAATSLILIPVLPIMAVIAAAIKLDSPGPIFFLQERVGEHGRVFRMIKFRSMVVDADKRRHEVVSEDSNGNLIHKQRLDPRITRVGHFIRRFSLDELPQLINVMKGDMSLVGPRPEMPWLVEQYQPWQRKRFEVPQGITGWWQVNGRSDKPMHVHTDEDLFYILNYSLWLDLRILWRTVGTVVNGKGAY